MCMKEKTIYFAGGCFWGMERVFQIVPGILETTVGYANGKVSNPSYELVCSDTTGHRETVKVLYDEEVISLKQLLDIYFLCIDPTVQNRQGHDIGSQYQTGVYYVHEEDQKIIESYMEEKKKEYEVFFVEYGALECFYDAEEYHQDYLMKNPDGYCHITSQEFHAVKQYLGEE